MLRPFAYPFRAMGSPCELKLYAASPQEAERGRWLARAEIERLEAKYSRYRPDSLLSRINAAAGSPERIAVDGETAALIDYAAQAVRQSDGRFDPTSGVLRRVWNFRTGRFPSADQIEALRPLIGWQRVEWESPEIRLPAGMELDFGGFVKEYAADAVVARLRAEGYAHGLINLGGDLALLGPHPDGTPWIVGIRHPRKPEQVIARIPLAAGALASSGDYERAFIHRGQRYSHVLDARSGWPVSGLAGVSVHAPQCLLAGTAATLAMLFGLEAGPRWLAESGLVHLCVDEDGGLMGPLGDTAGPELRTGS